METFFSPVPTESRVESSTPLANSLPRSPNGSMIITTRDKRVGDRLADRAKAIMILPMGHQEADDLLRLTVSLQDGSNESESKELLDALGYLPLAITQAAAFINENSITVRDYLEAFNADDTELQYLLSQDLGDSRRHFETQNSIIKTWKLSFNQISRQQPRAAELLSLMSVLDRQGIPKALLRNDNDRGVDFTTALGTLQAFSLISIERGGTNYEMHRLVQLSTQNWLDLQDTKNQYQDKALELLAERFPNGEYETWNECEILFPHAQIAVGYNPTIRSHILQHAELLRNLARYDLRQGRRDISCSRYSQSLNIYEAELGKENLKTLETMNGLVVALERHGKYSEAEPLCQQALTLCKKLSGKEHPNTLVSMNNLAQLLWNQGKYSEAEPIFRQTLALLEKVLGNEHPNTLRTINNLACLLLSQGKYSEAEPIFRQTLALSEKVLGKEHPGTIAVKNDLDRLLQSQGEVRQD
jgi:tetratricopeptide (TPR) repeat protein